MGLLSLFLRLKRAVDGPSEVCGIAVGLRGLTCRLMFLPGSSLASNSAHPDEHRFVAALRAR